MTEEEFREAMKTAYVEVFAAIQVFAEHIIKLTIAKAEKELGS